MTQRSLRALLWMALVGLCLLLLGSVALAQDPGPDDLPPLSWEQMVARRLIAAQTAPLVQGGVSLRERARVALSPLGPQPIENWSRVVFQAVTQDGGWDIFSIRLDGTDLRRLTSHPASDVDPRLNFQGTEVVFTSTRDGNPEIYKVPVDGSAPPQRLTDHPATDAGANWSPNGGQIVFSSSRDRQFDLYIMNADGSNPTRLHHDPYAHDIFPTYTEFGELFYVRYATEGATVRQLSNGEAVTPILDFIDYFWLGRYQFQDFMVFSADMDKDGAYELVYCASTRCAPGAFHQLTVLLDANDPNVDVVAGPAAPATPYDPGLGPTPPLKLMYLNQRFHKENDRKIIDDIRVYVGAFQDGNLQSATEIPILQWTVPGAWVRDDALGPVISIGTLPEYVFIDQMGTVRVPVDGHDPGGSGIVEFAWELQNETSGSTSWDQVQDNELPISLSSVFTREGQLRVHGLDWAGNWGPWSDWKRLKMYRGYIYGQAKDAHGRPIPQVRIVQIPPMVWPDMETGDLEGRFALRSAGHFANSPLELFHAGYGSDRVFLGYGMLFTHTLEGQTPFPFYLPPKEAVFQNGEFNTDSLADWTVSGDGRPFRIEAGTLRFSSVQAPAGLEKVVDLRSLHRPVFGLAYEGLVYAGTVEVNLEAGGAITPLVRFEQSALPTVNQDALLVQVAYPDGLHHDVYFDLTPWNTQVVTLSVRALGPMQNGTGVVEGNLAFDRVSLGSWTTPVIRELVISPTLPMTGAISAAAQDPITHTLTLTGENFLPGVVVRVGERTLTQVTRQGETRLEAILPTDLPPGMHPVWVINTDKTAAVWPNGVPVGRHTYIPVVHR